MVDILLKLIMLMIYNTVAIKGDLEKSFRTYMLILECQLLHLRVQNINETLLKVHFTREIAEAIGHH